ncbi:uncharacterized protein F5891DRAFT_1241509 [Suillus fuscotomentosus]|uniref:Uncharacterized protein n=1 Tax=Suillus fuscotomentosus TaxID=1912939 RepID=A0AAD4E127_9AGAM|nr:uncharacterized protein F5891DRAFT_1241509 [Suillus fuscotomentosus]KAG1897741.1 hypothetical protein F5891DRAFT_1241509 [Suillus fuscotomentosus]
MPTLLAPISAHASPILTPSDTLTTRQRMLMWLEWTRTTNGRKRNEYGKEMKRREEEKGGMRREEENEQQEEVEARRFIEERHHPPILAPTTSPVLAIERPSTSPPAHTGAHYFASANAYTTGFYQHQVTRPNHAISIRASSTQSQPSQTQGIQHRYSPANANGTDTRDYLPKFVDTHAPAVLAAVNADMQDIIDALDSLVQAISRQAHVMIAQTNALIQYSTVQFEQRAPEFEAIVDAFNARNEHAQHRAKELKDNGAKWLHEAGEALMHRASRARGRSLRTWSRSGLSREGF